MGVHFPRAEMLLRQAAARYTIAAAFRVAFKGWRSRKETDQSVAYTTKHAALRQFSKGGSFCGAKDSELCGDSLPCGESSSFAKFTKQGGRSRQHSSFSNPPSRGLRQQTTMGSVLGATGLRRQQTTMGSVLGATTAAVTSTASLPQRVWMKAAQKASVLNVLGGSEEKKGTPASSQWSMEWRGPPTPPTQSFLKKHPSDGAPAEASADSIYSMDLTGFGSALKQQEVSATRTPPHLWRTAACVVWSMCGPHMCGMVHICVEHMYGARSRLQPRTST